MDDMSFPLDIIFVAKDGTITRIHHAPVSGGFLGETYTGNGKYVLELKRGWTAERGVGPGDVVQVPENLSASDSWLWFTSSSERLYVNDYYWRVDRRWQE